MNVYDSGIMASDLAGAGYTLTDDVRQADLVLINTCTIREKAEQKAYSFLGRLADLKKKKAGLMIGVGGCLAQQEARHMLKRAPYVDIIFGTKAIKRLPDLIRQAKHTGDTVVDVEMDNESRSAYPVHLEKGPVADYVTIMQGCDNYCTYCVVPYVRGRETSRRPGDIVNEI